MKAYGYIRVSTRDQAEGGQSLPAQRDAIQRYYEYMLKPKGIEWGGIVEEEAVTASRPLCRRPNGGKMSSCLDRGDWVLFSKLDRGFRCTRDLLATVHAWRERGVHCRFLDIDVDTSTAAGQLHLTIMGAVAQFERSRLSERIKSMHAFKKAQGLFAHGTPPLGWSIQKTKEGNRLVPNTDERALATKCAEWMDKGWTVSRIHSHLVALNVKGRMGRTPSRTQIWSLAQAARNDYPQGGIRFLRGEYS